MTIENIYPPFEANLTDSHDEPGLFAVTGGEFQFKPGMPIYATSLFPDPEGRGPDDLIGRKGKTWHDCYVLPLQEFAKSGAQILLYLDSRLEHLAADLPANVAVVVMTQHLPGYDAMLWRYLGAAHGDVFFCGCDDLRHPPLADYLRLMKFDVIRWLAPCDIDRHKLCIFRTIKGGFYLRPRIKNIASILAAFYATDPIPTAVLGNPLFGNAKGLYGYDEVFTSRFFYYRYAENLATIVLRFNEPSLFFDSLDLPYLRSKNSKASVVYALQ